jgi:ribosome-associated toxin RatA of RatAB toxin-antitoxin module
MLKRFITPIRATDERMVSFPREAIWSVLADVATYPKWWPRTIGSRVLHEHPEIVGSLFELRPFGGKPFRCRIESIVPQSGIFIQYFGGFIEGYGEWMLEAIESKTRVQFNLNVHASGFAAACIGRLLPLGRIHSVHEDYITAARQKRTIEMREISFEHVGETGGWGQSFLTAYAWLAANGPAVFSQIAKWAG